MEEEKPPILKSWKNLYLLLVGTLIGVMTFLWLFTKYFE